MTQRIIIADVLDGLRQLGDGSAHCCVTSPPYWGLRDYGVDGQIGLEATPDEYVARMVAVFGEVRRVLRDDGTLWLNLGDSYAGSGRGGYAGGKGTLNGGVEGQDNSRRARERQGSQVPCGFHEQAAENGVIGRAWVPAPDGLKPKDLCMIPWRVALALQADGWWLRSVIVWAKKAPMPESVTDRPTSSWEPIFLLAKSERYWYDAEAVREPDKGTDHPRNIIQPPDRSNGHMPTDNGIRTPGGRCGAGANLRNVWHLSPEPFRDAHFATFPTEIPRRCIKAGCPVGGTVLDPFLGSGTTLAVAAELERNGVGIELNPEYAEIARDRIGRAEKPQTYQSQRTTDSPLFEAHTPTGDR